MAANLPVVSVYGPRAKPPDGIRANVTSRAAASEPGDAVDEKKDVNPFSGLSPFNTGPVSVYLGNRRLEAQKMENGWQYTKAYKKHTDAEGCPTTDHVKWAVEGFASAEAHRFPMGRGAKPEYSLWRNEKLGYQQARLLIYIPMYVEAIIKTPAARTAFLKLRLLHKRAIAEKKNLALFDYDGYLHRPKGMSYVDVICSDKKMGHAFVLAMILEDQLMSAIAAAARSIFPGRIIAPRDLPTDITPWRRDELHKALSIAGARVFVRQECLNRFADQLLEALLPGGSANVPWKYENIIMFGQECKEGRMTAHYGDPGTSYKYSGVDHQPHSWDDDPTGVLRTCICIVWLVTGQKCNYALLNAYMAYDDKLNAHSDSERDLIDGSYICSISVGGERDFVFESRNPNKAGGCRPPVRTTIRLKHGSLLAMGGLTQRTYKHSVPEGAAPRINITMRQVRVKKQ